MEICNCRGCRFLNWMSQDFINVFVVTVLVIGGATALAALALAIAV